MRCEICGADDSQPGLFLLCTTGALHPWASRHAERQAPAESPGDYEWPHAAPSATSAQKEVMPNAEQKSIARFGDALAGDASAQTRGATSAGGEVVPAIYQSHKLDESDSTEERQKKLYLAVMSCEEQAYTLGAAIGECRKQLTAIDAVVADIKHQWQELRGKL